jgi:hypothetical protein
MGRFEFPRLRIHRPLIRNLVQRLGPLDLARQNAHSTDNGKEQGLERRCGE